MVQHSNAADQLVAEWVQRGTNICDVTHSYSDTGCLCHPSAPAPPLHTNRWYSFDYDNRLSSVTSVTSVVKYLYDATGARVTRIGGATTNHYSIDPTELQCAPFFPFPSSTGASRKGHEVKRGARPANGYENYYSACIGAA